MVRTRFAPSPTGNLHLGGARTALFNWLWAKKNQGQFILRLEDTDQSRLQVDSVDQIMSALRWLGLDWNWGPDRPSQEFGSCIQSQRLDLYRQITQQLIDQGLAYCDGTSPKQLAKLRQQAQQAKKPFIFRRQMAQEAQLGDPQTVVRLAVKDDLIINWDDVVKGPQSWRGENISDFVILKSDGFPTYHLANVIDDHFMGISHVIRADEWLSSTPKHLLLFDQLQWPRPVYVHVSAVLNASGPKKLSKRDGATDLTNYRRLGYLPEAIINFLSLIGWNPGTEQEFFLTEQLIKVFDLDRLLASPGRFDGRRLDWLNGRHIRALTPARRYQQASRWWPAGVNQQDHPQLEPILELVFERLQRWSDLASATNFFFSQPTVDIKALEKTTKLSADRIDQLLKLINQQLNQISDYRSDSLQTTFYQLANRAQVKPGQLFMLMRLKLTGQHQTPNLFAIMELLGLATCRERLGPIV